MEEERNAEKETRLAKLHASIERGLADARAGRLIPAEEVFARLKEKYSEMAKKKS